MSVAERRTAVGVLLADLAARGPDCAVIIDVGGLSLGFCRLSITGQPGMVQPVRCRHVVAAVNGEIYNYRQLWDGLPRELRWTDRPTSDCAVVAPLALHDGTGFVQALDGVFAGVVADEKHGRLALFRDQVGVKPLHYLRLQNGLAFASTASALVPLTNREVHHRSMTRYLTDGYVAGEETLIKGIQRVPAGSVVTFTSPAARPGIQRWFNLHETRCTPSIREAVVHAVQSEIPITGPTVTTLSGGIDSTLVTLLAAREGADPLALTVAYVGVTADPDVVIAKRVAEDHDLRHELVTVSADDYRMELVNGWRFDAPLADPNAIALNRLSQRTSEVGSRVLMVGDGADEVFCGYPYYLDVAGRSPRHRLAAWRFASMTDKDDRTFASMLSGSRVRRPFRVSFDDPLQVAQVRDITNWLVPNLLEKADRFGMADQVEIRPPLLRKVVLRAGLGLPTADKVDRNTGMGKIALRAAFADLLPTYVLNRPKQGFPCPLGSWLRGELGRHLQDEATWSVADSWDVRQERELWATHISGSKDWGQQLWRLAVARSWWRQISKPRTAVDLIQLELEKVAETWLR
jgi:asparagine synthase (glutamine-hydrolysing)